VWEFHTYGRNGVWSCYKGGCQKFRKTSADEKRGAGRVGNCRQTVEIVRRWMFETEKCVITGARRIWRSGNGGD
jgi:hypothetical protein